MRSLTSRAGLTLGAIVLVCSPDARADDLRTQQVLLESGMFLAHAETTAAFARLNAKRAAAAPGAAKLMTFWESGSSSFGEADGASRLGYSGSATQMRAGADIDVSNGVIVGGMASAGFGSLGSGNLGAQTIGRHADVYARFGSGPLFAKALAGASIFDFRSIGRGDDGDKSHGSTRSSVIRAAWQFGGSLKTGGVTWTPTIDVAGYANGVCGYDERDGPNAMSYAARSARAAIGSLQIRGAKAVKVTPSRKVNVEGYLGAEEMLAFKASALHAVDLDGERVTVSDEGSPNGRGIFGGVGLGTALAPGVNIKLTYDYGLHDHVATHASRASLAVTF